MDDFVSEAATAVLPFLGAGAGAAVDELARQSGTGAAAALKRLVARLLGRDDLAEDVDLPAVEAALRRGLADGTVDPADVRVVAGSSQSIAVTANVSVINSNLSTRSGNISISS